MQISSQGEKETCSNDNHTTKRTFDRLEHDAKVLDYTNKVILAPMGTLPFRLLALEYGADIVYSEEIIALKLRQAKMVQNKTVGTIDFLKDGKESVFRTCQLDHPNILQLGAADPVVALQAAEMVSPFVDGIDLNMGCPKHFSIQGGMGAALLSKPQTVKEVNGKLKHISLPILDSEYFATKLEQSCLMQNTDAGYSAANIGFAENYRPDWSECNYYSHQVSERPKDPAHWDWMKDITELAKSGIRAPLIVNGDVFRHEDIPLVKEKTGASSVMIARGAMWNASIFSPTPVPIDDVIVNYLKKSVEVDNNFFNTKYVVMQMLKGMPKKHEKDEFVARVKELKTLCDGWNLQTFYIKQQKDNLQKVHEEMNKSCYDTVTSNENMKKIKTG